MSSHLLTLLGVCSLLLTSACSLKLAGDSRAPRISENTILENWTGPYGGVPAFDRVELAQLKPALVWGMEQHLAELDAIASNPESPTFDNTIVAMEGTGRDLNRIFTYWGIWSSHIS